MNTHKTTSKTATIALNKKALHDYHIERRFEAGMVLEGWEVKSMRAGQAQLRDSYVVCKNNQAYLLNSHITPLSTVPAYIKPNPTRSRKLLLHRKELTSLIGAVQRQGYTLIPLSLYWKRHCVKLEFALAKGKQLHDKRESEKKRDWEREKQRLVRK